MTLSFNLAPGAALSQALTAIDALQAQLGVPATVYGAFEGTAQAFEQSMTTIPLLIAAAVAAIYVIMGVLYKSFIHPITILSSLPPAEVGALLILMVFGYDLTLIAVIGIILLMGIVKKNAIMMIDFAIEAERIEGKSPLEAIHQACLLRFRLIMMTMFCALIAGLPLALETGAGSELRRPLGIAICRRAAGFLMADLVHDSCRLPLPRPRFPAGGNDGGKCVAPHPDSRRGNPKR